MRIKYELTLLYLLELEDGLYKVTTTPPSPQTPS